MLSKLFETVAFKLDKYTDIKFFILASSAALK